MEVFFKNLTAEETPTEKLVENVMGLVAEAEDLVKVTSEKLPEGTKAEVHTLLERMKGRCEKLRQQAMAGARNTDQFIRQHPYSSLGVAFGLGLVLGALIGRSTRTREGVESK